MAQKVQSITDLAKRSSILGSEIELPSNVELTIEGLSSGFRSDAVVLIMGAGGVDQLRRLLLADTLRRSGPA